MYRSFWGSSRLVARLTQIGAELRAARHLKHNARVGG